MNQASSPSPLAEQIAAAQAWWREAGVDCGFQDEPRVWLTNETPAPQATAAPESPVPATEPPKARFGGNPANWPQDLAAFRRWWLEDPSLDTGSAAPRIAPRGETNAALMILVPMPEREDRDAILSGVEGKLLASLVSAMGLTADAIYLAAALPGHMPLPDWEQLRAEGLGDVLLRHVHLADPKRLLVLGTRILPLLGHDPAQAAPGVSELSIQGRKVPVLASYAPERLLGNARQRAGLWRNWLDWTDEGNA